MTDGDEPKTCDHGVSLAELCEDCDREHPEDYEQGGEG